MSFRHAQLHSLSQSEREELHHNIGSFFEIRMEILFSYLHGSFLSGEGFRDIDVALYVDPIGPRPVEYSLQMEVLLAEELHFPFDVRLLNKCPPSFAYRVIKEGKRLYVRDDELRAAFEEGILNRYLDFLFYNKRYLREGFGVRA